MFKNALIMAVFVGPMPVTKESEVYMAAYVRLFTLQYIFKYRIPFVIISELTGVDRRINYSPKVCTSRTMVSVIGRLR